MYHMVQQQNKLCLYSDDEASDESTQSNHISPQQEYYFIR